MFAFIMFQILSLSVACVPISSEWNSISFSHCSLPVLLFWHLDQAHLVLVNLPSSCCSSVWVCLFLIVSNSPSPGASWQMVSTCNCCLHDPCSVWFYTMKEENNVLSSLSFNVRWLNFNYSANIILYVDFKNLECFAWKAAMFSCKSASRLVW